MGCRILESVSTPVVLVVKTMKTFQEEGQYIPPKYTLKCVGALKGLYKTCGWRWRLSGSTGKFHQTTIVSTRCAMDIHVSTYMVHL